jgi:hypothetical protein
LGPAEAGLFFQSAVIRAQDRPLAEAIARLIPWRIKQSERTETLMLLSRRDALLAKPLY